jgi:hypothetical protein
MHKTQSVASLYIPKASDVTAPVSSEVGIAVASDTATARLSQKGAPQEPELSRLARTGFVVRTKMMPVMCWKSMVAEEGE